MMLYCCGWTLRFLLIALAAACLVGIVPFIVALWAILHAIDRIERWCGLEPVMGVERPDYEPVDSSLSRS
jgi:hypothetical protein